MKPLSQLLTDLAVRAKKVEDSATALRDRNRALLQARREELESSIGKELKEIEADVADTRDAAKNWWTDLKNSIEEQVTSLRTEFEERQAERTVENAEQDAAVLAGLAGYLLEAAEWAAVQAELARAEAEEPSEHS